MIKIELSFNLDDLKKHEITSYYLLSHLQEKCPLTILQLSVFGT